MNPYSTNNLNPEPPTHPFLVRRITVAHLCFVRGSLEGSTLELRTLANQYLKGLGLDDGEPIDLRQAKSILSAVMHYFIAIARKEQMHGWRSLPKTLARRLHESDVRKEELPTEPPPPSTLEQKPEEETAVKKIKDMSFAEYVKHRLEQGVDLDPFTETEINEFKADAEAQEAQEAQEVQEKDEEADTSQDQKKISAKLARLDRVRKSQILLIEEIARKHIQAPSVLDEVHQWFNEEITQKFLDAHIFKVLDLYEAIHDNPTKWYKPLAYIGEKKAAQITNFIYATFGSEDEVFSKHPRGKKKPFPAHLMRRSLPSAQDISFIELQPIQSLPQQPPAAQPTTAALAAHFAGVNYAQLSGAQGEMRNLHSPNATGALNDYQLMDVWLSQKNSPKTKALYMREVERLIMWSIQIKGKAMSSLNITDATEYSAFLMNVPDHWISPRSVKDDSLRAPFRASLSAASARKALVIINSLFNWAQKKGYLAVNAFDGVKIKATLEDHQTTDASDTLSLEAARRRFNSFTRHTLPLEAQQLIGATLNQTLAGRQEEQRIRNAFIFNFLMLTGMRISEVCAARLDHLEHISSTPSTPGGLILRVIGKRNKPREIPLPYSFLGALTEYLAARNLLLDGQTLDDLNRGTFLVGKLPSEIKRSATSSAADGVTVMTVHRGLKSLFEDASKLARQQPQIYRPEIIKSLELATTHWLRHTSASQTLAAGVPIDVVSSVLGHASLSTTSIYVRAEMDRKLQEMQKYWSDKGAREHGKQVE
jgi:integrase